MRFRTVTSNVPGGMSFLGFARSQYHFGQNTFGGLGALGGDFLRREEESRTVDGHAAVESGCKRKKSTKVRYIDIETHLFSGHDTPRFPCYFRRPIELREPRVILPRLVLHPIFGLLREFDKALFHFPI